MGHTHFRIKMQQINSFTHKTITHKIMEPVNFIFFPSLVSLQSVLLVSYLFLFHHPSYLATFLPAAVAGCFAASVSPVTEPGYQPAQLISLSPTNNSLCQFVEAHSIEELSKAKQR